MSPAVDDDAPEPGPVVRPTRAILVLGLYTAIAGLASFGGWALDVPRLADWENDGISIQPNTTLAATSAGTALVLLALRRRRAAAAFGVAVGVIGSATLLQHILPLDLGIDTLFMFGRSWGRTATVAPGRMGLPASLSWTLTGAALVLLGGPRFTRAVSVIGLTVTGIAALSLTGYAFGADPLYALPSSTAIALQTSMMVFAVGLGLVAAVSERQPMRGLLERSAAGALTRRTLPLIIAVPLLLGFARLWGQTAGLYDTAMGTAMLVLALIGFLCAVLWWGAAAVGRHERELESASELARSAVRELEAVFRAAPVGFAITRDAGCEHVRVNAAFARMLGIDEGTNASLHAPGSGRLPFRILDEAGRDVAPTQLPLYVAAHTGTAVSRVLVIERAGGERTTIFGSAVPVDRAAGPSGGAIAVFMDMTAERRAAAEREHLLEIAEQARADAETANRAKDQFLAVLSHELRSPLNAMLGWVRILKRAGTGEEIVARAVETLERNVWAQSQVINDLHDISRITSGKIELERSRVDIAAAVAGCVESLRPLADGKRLNLELVLSNQRLEVDGDAARLQQVLANVLHNAIKFTPENGRVSMRARAHQGRVEIVVEDTGQGIDATILPHIFDRFVQAESTTTRRHGGLGLGLAIVKQLVALHGGAVCAASEGSGRGARFTVSLPLAAPRAADLAAARPAPAHDSPDEEIRSLDVLLVEDDPDSREALGIALEGGGASVRLAASVREALAAYDARPPDVLVSDISMPDEDGYALIRAIREREDGSSRRTLAIAMTGFASRQDHETALRAGFDEHVGKPVEVDALLERIRVLAASRGGDFGGRV